MVFTTFPIRAVPDWAKASIKKGSADQGVAWGSFARGISFREGYLSDSYFFPGSLKGKGSFGMGVAMLRFSRAKRTESSFPFRLTVNAILSPA